MSNRICSYFARFKSGPSASEYMEVDRKAERSVNLEMSGLVGIYLYHPDQKYHFELKCQQENLLIFNPSPTRHGGSGESIGNLGKHKNVNYNYCKYVFFM